MTDFRALCADLVKQLEGWQCYARSNGPNAEVLARARAALAQPEPQGPSNEELCQILHQAICDFPPTHPDALNLDARQYEIALQLRKARAVLARAFLAQPEPQGPTDKELLELMPESMRDEFSYAARVCSAAMGHRVKPGIFQAALNTAALEYARVVLDKYVQP